MSPRKPKTKRYVTEDGCYLAIDDRSEGFYIAWYIPEDSDFGAYVGEDSAPPKPPEDKEGWECWVAHKAVEPLADDKDDRGFVFETEKKAKLALAAADDALSNGHTPWPAWAIQAKDAGWTPPEGWKP